MGRKKQDIHLEALMVVISATKENRQLTASEQQVIDESIALYKLSKNFDAYERFAERMKACLNNKDTNKEQVTK